MRICNINAVENKSAVRSAHWTIFHPWVNRAIASSSTDVSTAMLVGHGITEHGSKFNAEVCQGTQNILSKILVNMCLGTSTRG